MRAGGPIWCLRIFANAERGRIGAKPDSQKFAAVRRLQTGPRNEETCGSSQDSQGWLPTCTAAEADSQAGAWAGAEIARFLDRRARLMRWGWTEPEAEHLAERLVQRDRDGDDRRLCIECRHYRPGRCGNHGCAGLRVPAVGRDLAAALQRCAGFQAW